MFFYDTASESKRESVNSMNSITGYTWLPVHYGKAKYSIMENQEFFDNVQEGESV